MFEFDIQSAKAACAQEAEVRWVTRTECDALGDPLPQDSPVKYLVGERLRFLTYSASRGDAIGQAAISVIAKRFAERGLSIPSDYVTAVSLLSGGSMSFGIATSFASERRGILNGSEFFAGEVECELPKFEKLRFTFLVGHERLTNFDGRKTVFLNGVKLELGDGEFLKPSFLKLLSKVTPPKFSPGPGPNRLQTLPANDVIGTYNKTNEASLGFLISLPTKSHEIFVAWEAVKPQGNNVSEPMVESMKVGLGELRSVPNDPSRKYLRIPVGADRSITATFKEDSLNNLQIESVVGSLSSSTNEALDVKILPRTAPNVMHSRFVNTSLVRMSATGR